MILYHIELECRRRTCECACTYLQIDRDLIYDPVQESTEKCHIQLSGVVLRCSVQI